MNREFLQFQISMNAQIVVIHVIQMQLPAIIHQEVTDVSVSKDMGPEIIKTVATHVMVMNQSV